MKDKEVEDAVNHENELEDAGSAELAALTEAEIEQVSGGLLCW